MTRILQVTGGKEKVREWLESAGIDLETVKIYVATPNRPNDVTVTGINQKDLHAIQNAAVRYGGKVFAA
jgi:aconitase A